LQQAISKQSKQGTAVLTSDQQAQVVSKLESASTSLAPPAAIVLPVIKLESTAIANSSSLNSTQDLRSQLSAVLDGKAAAHLTEQFSSRVVVMVQNSAQNAVIRLDPAELGHLEIQIETKADEIKVSVVTATHSVKEALEEHIHRLKEQMLQQGFDQVDVDVRQQQDSQQEADNTNASEELDEDEMLNEQPQQRLTQGLVDQFV
jgi:flagellar hook-length control protein FliK